MNFSGKHEGPSVSIQINSLDMRGSVCDGPGLRYVLYLQGCRRGCPGCHNPGTWSLHSGLVVSVQALAARIRLEVPNRRLTISGGEPLEQVSSVLALLDELNDFDLALYTGCSLEEIPQAILQRIRWIKVGNFDIQQLSTVTPFVGSINQRFMNACEAIQAQRSENGHE